MSMLHSGFFLGGHRGEAKQRCGRGESLSRRQRRSRLDSGKAAADYFHLSMSALFFKRFLQRPFQVASIIPSSKALVKKVARKMDFSEPRIIAEYGPGEGVHSRAIARRLSAASQLLLFELDPAFRRVLHRQSAKDPRAHVINGDPARLREELK